MGKSGILGKIVPADSHLSNRFLRFFAVWRRFHSEPVKDSENSEEVLNFEAFLLNLGKASKMINLETELIHRSVLGHFRIDLIAPGPDSSRKILHLLEARLLEKFRGFLAATS